MPRAKPASPLWQPGRAPAGCRGYWLLSEGAGPVVRDLSGRSGKPSAAFVGAPTWGRGLYGAQLGGFSTANYVAIDPPAQLLGTGVYPFGLAALFANTGSAIAQTLVGQGSSTTTAPVFAVRINSGTLGQVDLFHRDGSNVDGSVVVSSRSEATDGRPHVLMALAFGPGDRRIYLDGVQVGSNATTLANLANDTLTIGALRRTTVGLAATTAQVLAVAAFAGAAPDPAALAADWLSGAFAAARPRRQSWPFAGLPAGGYKVWYAGPGRGSALGSGAL